MAKNSSEHKEHNKEKAKDERTGEAHALIEKLINVRRVTKVVKGGKTLRFSALVVVGDGKGQVGYGSGKAREVPEAVRKATEKAKKTMIRVPLREGRTLHHDVSYRIGSGHVMMRSAVAGTGVIAGGAMRAVFEALGIQDVVAKSLGSVNDYNVVRATLGALNNVSSPKSVAIRLGKKLGTVVARRESFFGKKRTDEVEEEF